MTAMSYSNPPHSADQPGHDPQNKMIVIKWDPQYVYFSAYLYLRTKN